MEKVLLFLLTLAVAIPSQSEEIIDYGIMVNGIAVTSENSDNIIGNFIKGTIRYDADSNTLALQDASFFEISSSRTDCLNINVTGTNLMTTYYGELLSISCSGDLHITGTGRLITSSVNVAGSLTISGSCFIEAYQNGIIANALTIDKSILQTSSVQAEDIELIGCKQAFDNPIVLYCPEGESPQLYGITFYSVPVTSYNAANIIIPYTVDGIASYDVQANTLKLNSITNVDEICYYSYFPMVECNDNDLNIELIGMNVLPGTIYCKNLHVSGKGSLLIECCEGNPMQMSDLVLEGGCEFSTGIGAQGSEIHINSMTVNNSTFRCYFDNNFDLYVSNLTLIDADIEDKNEFIYDSESGRFIHIGENPYSEVVIKPTGLSSIQDIDSFSPNVGAYYDMQGRRMSEPAAPGIYIKDGKKVVVK